MTRQEKLEWLARNVHEWKQGFEMCVVNTGVGETCVTWPSICTPSGSTFTKSDWRSMREKLQIKRDRLDMLSVPVVDKVNSWHERGELPPVGAVCECGGCAPADECEIVAYSDDQVCVRWRENKLLDVIDITSGAVKFSPLRTEREKAIDAACKAVGGVGEDVLLVIEKLYDAGMLK